MTSCSAFFSVFCVCYGACLLLSSKCIIHILKNGHSVLVSWKSSGTGHQPCRFCGTGPHAKLWRHAEHPCSWKDNGQHLAVVGLALSLEPGDYMLQHMGKQIPFQVHPKKYLEQRIYLENKRHVTPNTLDLDRIKGESQKQIPIKDAY